MVGLHRRGQRGNGLAGAGVLADTGGRGLVARGARPLATVAAGEEGLAARRVTGRASLGAPVLQLLGGGGVARLGGQGGEQGQGQQEGGFHGGVG